MLSFFDGEWMLRKWENGGLVVFLRSLWVACWLFLVAVILFEAIEPGGAWSVEAARTAVSEHAEWLGALFAGAYVTFYSRFSSQWTYIAGVYNQIMAALVQSPDDGTNKRRSNTYASWKAGVVEDIETLHLASKPMFAGVVASLLAERKVKDAYIAAHGGRRVALETLEQRINDALGADAVRTLQEFKEASLLDVHANADVEQARPD